jgi:hypothetical protein
MTCSNQDLERRLSVVGAADRFGEVVFGAYELIDDH